MGGGGTPLSRDGEDLVPSEEGTNLSLHAADSTMVCWEQECHSWCRADMAERGWHGQSWEGVGIGWRADQEGNSEPFLASEHENV